MSDLPALNYINDKLSRIDGRLEQLSHNLSEVADDSERIVESIAAISGSLQRIVNLGERLLIDVLERDPVAGAESSSVAENQAEALAVERDQERRHE